MLEGSLQKIYTAEDIREEKSPQKAERKEESDEKSTSSETGERDLRQKLGEGEGRRKAGREGRRGRRARAEILSSTLHVGRGVVQDLLLQRKPQEKKPSSPGV